MLFPCGRSRTLTLPRNCASRVLVLMVRVAAWTEPVGMVALTGSTETILPSLE
jgi:hypothetical protein